MLNFSRKPTQATSLHQRAENLLSTTDIPSDAAYLLGIIHSLTWLFGSAPTPIAPHTNLLRFKHQPAFHRARTSPRGSAEPEAQ